MPNYRRWYLEGGTSFFTVVTYDRYPLFRHQSACELLGDVMRNVASERPFTTDSIVLLHDHLHAIWTLPEGDDDYSTRWKEIKSRFIARWLERGGEEAPVTESQRQRGHRGVWQKRFRDRLIRNEDEFKALLDYVHYNPVKHGYVSRPSEWRYSSFMKWVGRGEYEVNWGSDPESRVGFIEKGYD